MKFSLSNTKPAASLRRVVEIMRHKLPHKIETVSISSRPSRGVIDDAGAPFCVLRGMLNSLPKEGVNG